MRVRGMGKDVLLFTCIFGPFCVNLGGFVCVGKDATKMRFSSL